MFRKWFQAIVVIMLVASTAVSSLNVSALAPLPQDEIVIAYHPLTGMARFIGAEVAGQPIQQATAQDANSTNETVARSFLATEGSKFGITDAKNDLKVLRKTRTEVGTNTVRFQQTYQGVPIFAGEMIVQMDSHKNVLSANGEILPNINLDIVPQIDEAIAIQTALQATAKESGLNIEDLQASTPELWIYNPALLTPYKGETVLSWRIEVTPKTGIALVRQLVLVEASRGGIALSFNQVPEGKNRLTYNAGSTSSLPGTLVCNESNPSCSGGSADAVNAHVYAGQTYDFYLTNHGRDSIDGAGMSLISTVNYDDDPFDGFPFDNAFWDGTQMVYGPGYSNADDIVAHELTHGITEHESGLYYFYQSGAINESFSDVWGEFVDLGNGLGTDTGATRWQIGEDLDAAFRDMQDPTIFGDPDKITSVNYYTGASDSGGVHWNSGVNNKAAYLMVDGDTFNGKTVTGLGVTKVAKIYYYAQSNLLVSGSDYADLYYALQASCTAQIGIGGITSGDCVEVKDAVDAVEMNLQPVAGFNTNIAACPVAGEYPANNFYDDLESGSANWISGAITGTDHWSYDWPYSGQFAHSGQHFLYANDYPASVTDTYLRMTNSVTVPTGGRMLFHHAYNLENTFDGGILEYSINGGASWNNAGSLMDSNGYDAPLSLSYGNPLGGLSAFTGASHGYISTRLNLSSLAGQNVMFRFRLGLDPSVFKGGWSLDDIQIYSCRTGPSVNVTIGGADQGQINIADNSSTRINYVGVNNGPAQVVSSTDPIIDSLRVLYGGVSYSEMIGFPASQLTTNYWFPYYNNVAMNSQLRVSNVGASSTTITVTYGNNIPLDSYTLAAGAATRKNYAGINDGPLHVTSSSSNILTTIRVLYGNLSYSELVGFPNNQVTTDYWYPYYNNVAMNSQLRVSNVGISSTTITVTYGNNIPLDSYTLAAGAATRKNYAGINSGPLHVTSSSSNILTTIRVLYGNQSFSEISGFPATQLVSEYWYPVYDNVTVDSQLRVSNVGGAPTTITVYGANNAQIDTYALAAGASTRKNYTGVNNGPLHVVSSGSNILSTQRLLYVTPGFGSFYELTGLPASQITTNYYFPYYNNVAMSSQLRIAVP